MTRTRSPTCEVYQHPRSHNGRSRQSPLETVEGMASDRLFKVEYQRKKLPRNVKEFVWSMTYGTCWSCGGNLNPFSNVVVEHVVPLCRGGSDDIENLVPACSWCNHETGAKTGEEWRPFFADSEGQGPDPAEWVFWFEAAPDELMPGHGRKRVDDRHDWRDIQIQGFSTDECGSRGVDQCPPR